jgi:two-component system chemotaxis sensor kinase CheA
VRQLSGAPEEAGGSSVASLVEELGRLEAQGRAYAAEQAEEPSHGEQQESVVTTDSAVSVMPIQEAVAETAPEDEGQFVLGPQASPSADTVAPALQAESVEEAPGVSASGKRPRAAITPRKTTARRTRTPKKKASVREEHALASEASNAQVVIETVSAATAAPSPEHAPSFTDMDSGNQTVAYQQDQTSIQVAAFLTEQEDSPEHLTFESSSTVVSSSDGEDQAHGEMLARLRGLFAIEAAEHLQIITDTLLTLEHDHQGVSEDELLETLFRRMHTLKGAARAVNLRDIEALCQVVENVCAALKRKEFRVWPEFFDTLHRMTDLVQHLSAEPEGPAREKVADMLAEVDQLEAQGRERARKPSPVEKSNEQNAPPSAPTLQAVRSEDEQEVSTRATHEQPPLPGRQAKTTPSIPAPEPVVVPRLTAANKASVQATPLKQPKQSVAAQEKSANAKKAVASTETVRIKASKLDALFLQAEEMLAVKLKTSLHAAELRGLATMLDAWRREWAKVHTDIRKTQRLLEKEENRSSQDPIYVQAAKLVDFLDWTHDHLKALDKTLLQVTRAVAQDQQSLSSMVDILLEDAKKVLMLPFASALEVLPKMVRDLSRAQGKDIDFTLQGGEVEIDKRILEEMKDPLIHLLRNCVDHGIESPGEREQRQKPPRGAISLAIAPGDGNTVEIVVTDDGAGIDVPKVRAAAVKCGLISRKAVEQLSDQEALALIFQSEVSTSATVSDLSGRGLGMAIVREKVEKLGGQIAVETQPHHGSTFRIRLPLTLATFRGIQVHTAGQIFVVPTANVERVVRVKREDIHTVANKEMISLAGYTLPLIRLDRALGLTIKARNDENGRFQLALVVGQEERQIAFGVDTVVSEQEVLFKSLGKQLVRVRNIAGATILGSGQVVPVLNISDLLASAGGNSLALPLPSVDPLDEEPQKRSILVAEDSITSRMLLKEILESAGYTVATAIDGEDAFSTLQRTPFDLIVSDVEMPRMNGFALTSKIRGDERYAQLPVVLVTGLESQADRERGIDAGANAYVVKGSFDQSNLLETIRRLI